MNITIIVIIFIILEKIANFINNNKIKSATKNLLQLDSQHTKNAIWRGETLIIIEVIEKKYKKVALNLEITTQHTQQNEIFCGMGDYSHLHIRVKVSSILL